jgi:tetratricopeptide (TPR) repeat protein
VTASDQSLQPIHLIKKFPANPLPLPFINTGKSLRMRYRLNVLLWLVAVTGMHAASIPETPLKAAHADLDAGRADRAIARLSSSLASDPSDAEAHNLLCRVYFQEERWDDAIRECETAVRLSPSSSEYHLWLGRAYGEKADSIHSIKAYGLAKKVRDEFERAVQLDGSNADALSDLGEFYTAAPGIVGGGKQKAQSVADTMQALHPTQAHELKARLAEKDKNYSLAENEYKLAVEASRQAAGSQSPSSWMDLASFYARRGQWDSMSHALHAGLEADQNSTTPHGPALVDAARILTHSHQDPALAIDLLRQYLASPNQSADFPAFRVHTQLSRLLDQQGDHEGAQHQIEAATSLARDYHPALPKSSSP